jgi:type II secretory pathway pseudopilin PulG
MIELLLVGAILGILVTLAFTSYQRVIMERRVQNVTRELAAIIRVAQQAAVAQAAGSKCVGVAFKGTERRAVVYVVPAANPIGSPICANPTADTLMANGLLLQSHEYPVGVTVAVTPSVGPGGAVTFLPTGSPCSGDNCARQVHITGGNHQRDVCIAGGSGLVTVPRQGGVCP